MEHSRERNLSGIHPKYTQAFHNNLERLLNSLKTGTLVTNKEPRVHALLRREKSCHTIPVINAAKHAR